MSAEININKEVKEVEPRRKVDVLLVGLGSAYGDGTPWMRTIAELKGMGLSVAIVTPGDSYLTILADKLGLDHEEHVALDQTMHSVYEAIDISGGSPIDGVKVLADKPEELVQMTMQMQEAVNKFDADLVVTNFFTYYLGRWQGQPLAIFEVTEFSKDLGPSALIHYVFGKVLLGANAEEAQRRLGRSLEELEPNPIKAFGKFTQIYGSGRSTSKNPRVHFVNPTVEYIDSETDVKAEEFLASAEDSVVISFGSYDAKPDMRQKFLGSVADLAEAMPNVNILVVNPEHLFDGLEDQNLENVMVVKKTNFARTLPKAKALISAGGMGMVITANNLRTYSAAFTYHPQQEKLNKHLKEQGAALDPAKIAKFADSKVLIESVGELLRMSKSPFPELPHIEPGYPEAATIIAGLVQKVKKGKFILGKDYD